MLLFMQPFPAFCYFLLLVSNILLYTLLSNILNLSYSVNVKDRVSHPYKVSGKIIFVYILIPGDSRKKSELTASPRLKFKVYLLAS
jgi:hypothetical protein